MDLEVVELIKQYIVKRKNNWFTKIQFVLLRKERMIGKIEATPKQIARIKKEFREKHKVIGTNEPVILNDFAAKIIVEQRIRRRNWLRSIHKTHKMTSWRSEVRCPASTPRFYGVRNCKYCGFEQMEHPAGRFIDDPLTKECSQVLKRKKK